MSKFQKKQQSILSVTNLVIASIIIVIVLIIALSNVLENPESRQIRQAAEKKLRLFARGNSLDAINCESSDEKNNGWLNCRASNRQGQTVLLQCPYSSDQECHYQSQK